MSESSRWIGKPAEWTLSIVVPIFKAKGDIRNYRCYNAMMLLESGMKMVERMLGKRLCRILTVNEMYFGFIPEKGTIDVVFVFRRMQEEHQAEGKSYLCSWWNSKKLLAEYQG